MLVEERLDARDRGTGGLTEEKKRPKALHRQSNNGQHARI
jgi:hypothetical protein